MTQEQFDGLKPGDEVFVRALIRPGWGHDAKQARVLFPFWSSAVLLPKENLELPRPSAPEGYEEFWPRSFADVKPGDMVGNLVIDGWDGLSIAFKPFGSAAPFLTRFDILRALGVPFYRPIKKEPEEWTGKVVDFTRQVVEVEVESYEGLKIGQRVKVVPCE